MENNSISKTYFENLNEKNNSVENKNKILYKFKILSKNPKYQNQIGKCYLINLNFTTKSSLSQTKIKKRHEKLPLIKIKYNQTKLNTITSSKSRESPNKEKNKLTSSNEYKTLPLSFNPSHTKTYINLKNKKSSPSLTESSTYSKTNKENKTKYNDIINKINEKYFVKNSTMKYLTTLFFGNNDIHDLKYVNLSSIKDKKQKYINVNDNKNKQLNNVSKYNYKLNIKLPHKRYDSFNDKTIENYNENEMFKNRKYYINEKIKKFKNLKLKKCKELVDDALKDLIKTKEKNFIFIENFRKSCDFKFEEFYD